MSKNSFYERYELRRSGVIAGLAGTDLFAFIVLLFIKYTWFMVHAFVAVIGTAIFLLVLVSVFSVVYEFAVDHITQEE